MMLTPDEIERYKRQLVLKEIGGEGQQKLKAARVLVVGAGGLGSPLILYLAAAGVGEIGIIDDDRVSLDNLQRQVVHDTKHVGQAKTRSAAAAVERLNPHVATRLYSTRLVPENALAIISGYDIVADGSDNFATRYLVNERVLRQEATASRRWALRRSPDDLPRLETLAAIRARPIAASFPSRPPKARSRPARKRAFSALSRASSALLPRSKWSRSCSALAKASSAGFFSTTRSRRGSAPWPMASTPTIR
jgi:adenylyltransferase/sulfurtransferase